MTKTRLLYIVVLAIALLILLWDRTHSGRGVSGPAVTHAGRADLDDPKLAHKASPFDGELTAEPFEPATRRKSVSDSLNDPNRPVACQDRPPRSRRDVFLISPQFSRALQPQPDPSAAPAAAPADKARQLRLSAIILRGQDSCALINDEVVFIGRHIGPYRLLHLKTDRAVLEVGGENIELILGESPR